MAAPMGVMNGYLEPPRVYLTYYNSDHNSDDNNNNIAAFNRSVICKGNQNCASSQTFALDKPSRPTPRANLAVGLSLRK